MRASRTASPLAGCQLHASMGLHKAQTAGHGTARHGTLKLQADIGQACSVFVIQA